MPSNVWDEWPGQWKLVPPVWGQEWWPWRLCECVSLSVLSDSVIPEDCSLPGSSVHGILQARILEWVAISFSRGSSQPRDWTLVSCIAGEFFAVWARRGAPWRPWQVFKPSQGSRSPCQGCKPASPGWVNHSGLELRQSYSEAASVGFPAALSCSAYKLHTECG